MNDGSIIGLGIVLYYEGLNGTEGITILIDSLTQYNMLAQNQKSHAVSTANTSYDKMFSIPSKYIYNDGTTKWVNTGILSLTSSVGSNNITTPGGYEWTTVSMLYSGNLCTSHAAAAQHGDEYSSTAQDPVPPTTSFEYPTTVGKKNYQAATSGSPDYCYWDSSVSSIQVGFAEGGSKSFDPNILTVTKNGKTITPQVKLDDGSYHPVSQTISLTTEGIHILTYQYTDPYNYRYEGVDSNGDPIVTSYSVTYTKNLKINVTVAQANIDPATFDFNGNGYRTVTANNKTYVMPNVTGTAQNSIGSMTVGGQTVYYPIVWSKNSRGTSNATSAPVLCPVFDGVVTITDHNENNEDIVYGSNNTNMADNKLVAVSDVSTGSSFLSWGNGATPPADNPCIVNGKLYYKSITISGVNRDQTTYTCDYKFTDTAGNVYYYRVGYIFPKLQKTCVATGTLVTMADGTQKPIENVNVGDMVLTWSFERGTAEVAPVAIKWYHGTDNWRVLTLRFSDGTEIRTIAEHGFFDSDLNSYV